MMGKHAFVPSMQIDHLLLFHALHSNKSPKTHLSLLPLTSVRVELQVNRLGHFLLSEV